MKTYYFTFGNSPIFPYQRGWVEVRAGSKKQACDIFRAYFPDRITGRINCASIYTEEEWQKTKMSKGDYYVAGEFCQAKIGMQERREFNSVSLPLENGFNLCAEINPDQNYKEIFVGVTNELGDWKQDLAIVRQKYHYDHDLKTVQEDKYEVLVFADKENEDYTHAFTVERYISEGEDE